MEPQTTADAGLLVVDDAAAAEEPLVAGREPREAPAPFSRVAAWPRLVVAGLAVASSAAVLLLTGGSRAESAATPAAARQAVLLDELPASGPAKLCTDGWVFNFTTIVEYSDGEGGEVLTSESGALSLEVTKMVKNKDRVLVAATMMTPSYGSVRVANEVNASELHAVSVQKDGESFCLSFAPKQQLGNFTRRRCTFKPSQMPVGSFQMDRPGPISLRAAGGAKATSMVQHYGMVPVSLVVSDVRFAAVWADAASWDALHDAVKSALAYAAGNGILPGNVHAVGLLSVDGGALFEATVQPPPYRSETDLACQVQDSIAAAIKSGAFASAVTDRVTAAGIKEASASTTAKYVETPARSLLCSTVSCRFSENKELRVTSTCWGFGCASTCCDHAWSTQTLPYDGDSYTLEDVFGKDVPNTPTSAKGFVWKDPTAGQVREAPKPSAMSNDIDKKWGGPGSLEDKLKQVDMKGYEEFGEIFTDGVSFSFSVNVKLSVGAFSSEKTVIGARSGGLRLSLKRDLLPGTGRFRFEVALLDGDTCAVDSGGVHISLQGQNYSVTLSKDDQQCCIEVHATPWDLLGGLTGWKKLCSTKEKQETSFQMLPVPMLWKPKASWGVAVSDLKQSAGSLTMSFGISALSYEKMTQSCQCMDDVVRALEESITFAAGVGTRRDQVKIAIARSASFGGAKPTLTNDQLLREHQELNVPDAQATPAGPSEEALRSEEAGKEKLQMMINGSYYKDPHHDLALTPEEKAAKLELEAQRKRQTIIDLVEKDLMELQPRSEPVFSGVRRLALWQAMEKDAEKNDPAFKSWAVPVLDVQVTIENCGDMCAQQQANLLKAAADSTIVKRIIRKTGGDGENGKVSVGNLALMQKSVPANPTRCLFFQCPAFTGNPNPFKVCYGASCEQVCCQDLTVSEVTCGGGLIPSGAPPDTKCRGEADCRDKACLQPCPTVQCTGMGVSQRRATWFKAVTPSNSSTACCQTVQCCDGNIAFCMACLWGQSLQAYCKAQLFKILPMTKSSTTTNTTNTTNTTGTRRRLHDLPGVAPSDLSGGLPEHFHPTGASAEEIAMAIKEREEIVARTIRNLGQSQTARRPSVMKRRLLEAKNQDRIDLLKGMQQSAEDAASYRLQHLPNFTATPDPDEHQRKQWADSWNDVVLQAKETAGALAGAVSGCSSLATVPCGYTLKSVFLLHRGVAAQPKSVNTVAVLTDTTHAVSCGDDYVCWVWKIDSGMPSQAFIPNMDVSLSTTADTAPQRGPVYTVTVMNDAAFILSAGANAPDSDKTKGGTAFIWDWIHGIQRNSFACVDGIIKASAEMPVWRMSLLGCSNGFSTMWNWGTGNSLALPLFKRTPAEIADAIKKRLQTYYSKNMNGWERWALQQSLRQANVSTDSLFNWIKNIDPNLKSESTFWKVVQHFLEPQMTLGAVNSMAYVPANLRFVTGSSDGYVRYWNSDSGRLLMTMTAGTGSINAVSALPAKEQAVSGGDDGVARLWDLTLGAQVMIMYQPSGGPINAVAVMPCGTKVAVGSDDGYVRIYDLGSGVQICGFNTGSAVKGIAINPSNPLNQIITANEDGYARVWNP